MQIACAIGEAIEALAVGLQKIHAQLEASKPTRQVVNNPENRHWNWSCVSAIESNGRTIWIADAHRDDGRRFVMRADEKLTAFVELESAIRAK